MKTVDLYWYNGLSNSVSFYNDTLDESNHIGDVNGSTPIKLSVDILTTAQLVIKQVSQDKILISSVDIASISEAADEVLG
jgi:hypothetical protein